MNCDNQTLYISDSDIVSSENNCISDFEYSKASIWNSSFTAPEISCDFELLHQDLQEIKALINDVKDCLKDFICHNEK